MITVNPERTDELIDELIVLWKDSVRASHDFLTDEDICRLIPFVRAGLTEIGLLAVIYTDGRLSAFMGVQDDKVEMLFVRPSCFGQGIGKALVLFAIEKYAVKYVDVNEQNPRAAGFYRRLGFEVCGRTELDGQGNLFPILQMRLDDTGRKRDS